MAGGGFHGAEDVPIYAQGPFVSNESTVKWNRALVMPIARTLSTSP